MQALKRHRVLSVLLFVQVAMTCAVVTNVLFLIISRTQLLHQPSGIDEKHLAVIESERVVAPAVCMSPGMFRREAAWADPASAS